MLRVHPDLAGRVAQQGALTSESAEEQRSAGLTELTAEEQQQLTDRNHRSADGGVRLINQRIMNELMNAWHE